MPLPHPLKNPERKFAYVLPEVIVDFIVEKLRNRLKWLEERYDGEHYESDWEKIDKYLLKKSINYLTKQRKLIKQATLK